MSLSEQGLAQINGDNITEYTFITGAIGENGEFVQQMVQHMGATEQENIDPSQQQVLMLQPIAVPGGGEQQDGQLLQQYQILHDSSTIEHLQQIQAALGEHQVLQISPEMLHQHLLQGDGTVVEQQQQPLQEHKQNNQLEEQQIQFIYQPDAQQIDDSIEPEPLSEAAECVRLKVAQATLPIPIKKEPDIRPPVGKGPFKCEKCEKIFPKWGAYNRHMKSHDEDKPFSCSKCTSTFNMEDNLRLHEALHQTDNPKCPECGKKFSRIASLKAHIMLHEKEESLICPECGDEFALQSQLDRHMHEHRDEMEGSKTYPCKQCTQEFTKPLLLREHMKQHYKIRHSLSHKTYKKNIDRSAFHHKCTHCSKTFQKPSQLQRHLRIHTGERPYACSLCDKSFNQKGALQIHMSKHTGDKPHRCNFCPMLFSQKGNLRAHIQRVHNTPKDANMQSFKCDECSCVYRKLGSLNAHMSRAHSDTQDMVLSVNTRKSSNGKDMKTVIEQLLSLGDSGGINPSTVLDKHNMNSDILQQALENSGLTTDVGSVDDTGKVTKPTSLINITSQSQAPTTSQADGLNITMVTQEEAQTVEKVLEQVQNATGMMEGDQEMAATSELAEDVTVISLPKEPPQSIISTMSIHDSATGTIKRHIIRKINGVRWHQCVYCSKEFKKPSDLIRHIRIHTHEKPYKCTQCFRSFAVKSTLTSHMKTHLGLKEFRCMTCDKLFSTQGSLKVHARLHTGIRPFDCPHCDKRFRTSGHRKTHIISHFRSPNDRKVRKSSKRSSKPDLALPDIALQEPILITDTGLIQQPPRSSMFPQILGEGSSIDRPFKCIHCNRGFKKSSHLKQHVRSHTGEKPYKCSQCYRQFVSSGVLKAHIRTHMGIKSYKCLLCDSTFTTNGSLKRHMSTHSDMRPFMCPYCQKTFKTSVNCKKHMKTHKQELAMQALQQGGEEIQGAMVAAKNEVTISTIPDADDDEDDGMIAQEIQIEIAQDDLTQTLIPVGHLNNEHHNATAFLAHHDPNGTVTILSQEQHDAAATLVQESQVEMMQEQHNMNLQQQVLSQAELQQVGLAGHTVIQDSLGELQLTNSLNQQVLEQQGLVQTSDHQQQILNQVQLNSLQLNPTQYTLQPTLDNGSMAQTVTSVGSGLQSTSMQNILQTKDTSEMSIDGEAVLDLEPPPESEAQNVTFEDIVSKTVSSRRPHRCPMCEKSFKKSSHLKQHMRSHTGEKPYKCTMCSRYFVSMGVLRAHMKTHQGSKDYKCVVCNSVFTTNGSLTRHMMVHTAEKPYKCPHCNDTFRTANPCRRHIRLHREQYVPGLVAEKGTEDLSIKRSKNNFIRISEEQALWLAKVQPDENMSLSEKLLIESAGEKTRVSHIKQEMTEAVEEEQEEEAEHVIKDELHQNRCPHCHKSFKKPSDLVRHVRIHTGEKPYACDLCTRTFTVKSTLESHMKTHTPGEKRFKCHVCESMFATKGSMKVHMRLHTGAKPFQCPHCNIMFRTSGHRKSHIQSHFKTTAKKIRKTQVNSKLDDLAQVIGNEMPLVNNQTISINEQTLGNQVINIDQSALQQGVLPISLSITDSYGNLADNNLAAQVLQSLEGIQLQLTGNMAQNIQLTGVDPSALTQAIQIDASVLQQLQQGGNVNLTINPSFLNVPQTGATTSGIQTVDPNHVQNFVQPSSALNLTDVVNPNVVIQSLSNFTQEQAEAITTSAGTSAPEPLLLQKNDGTATTVTELSHQQAAQVEQQTLEALGVIQKHTIEQTRGEGMQTGGEDDPFVHEGVSEEALEQFDDAVLSSRVMDTEAQPDDAIIPQGTAYEVIHVQGEESTPTWFAAEISDPDRTHVCPTCNKAFKRSGHLKEHMMTHGPGPSPSRLRPTRYRCGECDKAFAKPSQLERHLRIHTGERPYTCELCSRSFNQKNALQVHLKKHSGEKPHKCPYCESDFTQKGNLKTHIKRAHHHEMVLSMNLNPKQEEEAEEEGEDEDMTAVNFL